MKQAGKPILYGMSRERSVRHLVTALLLSAIGGWSFKTFVGDRRKRIYKEFYENYDIDKEFNRMKAKGLFDSCK